MANRTLIRGNKALAEALGVSLSTVNRWRRQKILIPATVVDYCRTIVYDMDKVTTTLTQRVKTR